MLYIILGIIMVFYAWMHAALGKLQKNKNDARKQWVRVDALLQTRSQYILRLLELADEYGLEAGELLAEIYELNGGYCKSEDREVISACAEEVTPLADRLLELAQETPAVKDDSEFQELKDNLLEIEEELEIQSGRYNHSIELYNQHLANPRLRLQFAILGAPALKGLHIRPNDSSLADRSEEQN